MLKDGYATIELDCGIIYSGQLLGTREREEQFFLVMKPSETSDIKVYMPIKEIKQMITDKAQRYTKEEIQSRIYE